MFADVGYANVFHQAGLFGMGEEYSSYFSSISTVSGGSWFSTQLFYSTEFYNRTVLATNPQQINNFVLEWMDTYYDISTDIDEETIEVCDDQFEDLKDEDNEEIITALTEMCYLLVTYDYDWALFIEAMLQAAADGYGTTNFVNILANASNIINPLQSTDLLIQTALAPASRIRGTDSSTASYLGKNGDGDNEQLWTVALSAAWIVDTSSKLSSFVFGINDDNNNDDEEEGENNTNNIEIYLASTPNEHSWDDWSDFYLYTGNGTTTGNNRINNSLIGTEFSGIMRPPFGGNVPTTLQVAATSSAAAASASPLAPVSYTQNLSIGLYAIETNLIKTVWRVLAGIAAGLGGGLLLGWAIAWASHKWKLCQSCSTQRRKSDDDTNYPADGENNNINGSNISSKNGVGGDNEETRNDSGCKDEGVGDVGGGEDNNNHNKLSNSGGGENEDTQNGDENVNGGVEDIHDDEDATLNNCCCCYCQHPARNWGIGCGVFFGILVGVVTGVFYGVGSIIVPSVYDESVNEVYQNTSFDNFAVCSQWPNLPCQEQDAYMLDGWFVDNPALPINIGHQQTKIGRNETIKVILTNCNQVWDDEWTQAQYLAYFATYFNTGIAPGDFNWGPGWFIPSRSQQIFSDYLDRDGLNALVKPIVNSNMTTALLQGTTIDNPAYNVRAGQRVEMLLLNLNANITTYVVGKTQIEEYTQPLADMASHIAGSEDLVVRVREFVME